MSEKGKIQLMEFEQPLKTLVDKIFQLENSSVIDDEGKKEIEKCKKLLAKQEKELYKNLSAWQINQIARHPLRPGTEDFVQHCTTEAISLHGDRYIRDDPSMGGFLAKIDGQPFMIIGHQKGKNTLENVRRNFGMPHPEGYKKAIRLMKLADKFSLPVLTFIDTPGAYPGVQAEERQQSIAIAESQQVMGALRVPVISVVSGEGGSGGALAIGVANRVLMMQYSVYSVISPEGCASILWSDNTKANEAAAILKMTADDLYRLGVVEEILPEPMNGAHRDPTSVLQTIKKAVLRHYRSLSNLTGDELVEFRYKRFRRIGEFVVDKKQQK